MIITSGVMLRSIYASGQHTDTAGGGCRSSFPSSFRGSADGYKHKGLLLRGCDPVQRVRFASLNIANNVKSLAGWAFSQSKKCQGWTVFLMQNRAVFVDSDAISKAQSRGQGTKRGGFGLYGRSVRLSDGGRLLGWIRVGQSWGGFYGLLWGCMPWAVWMLPRNKHTTKRPYAGRCDGL